MRWILIILPFLYCATAQAEVLVAAKTIRANSVLSADDVAISPQSSQLGLTDPQDAIGMETRVVLYAGRPIRAEDLQSPALVNRNQIVPLVFQQGGLTITTMGRALDRGASGDIIRVMNMQSKSTLFGTVGQDGRITVSNR